MRLSAGTRLSLVVLAVALVAGCGAAASPGAADRQLAVAPEASPSPEAEPSTPFGFLEGVGLTAAQKAEIKAIAVKYRPAEPTMTAASSRAARFKAILAAETLDETALGAIFREDLEAGAATRAKAVTMYAEVREALTEEQRTEAAAAIDAALAQPVTEPSTAPQAQQSNGGGGGSQGPSLTLTDAQQALFKAAVSAPPDARVVAKAIATLMRTGEKDPLTTALAPKMTMDESVAALVKAFASLTPAQRKTLTGS